METHALGNSDQFLGDEIWASFFLHICLDKPADEHEGVGGLQRNIRLRWNCPWSEYGVLKWNCKSMRQKTSSKDIEIKYVKQLKIWKCDRSPPVAPEASASAWLVQVHYMLLDHPTVNAQLQKKGIKAHQIWIQCFIFFLFQPYGAPLGLEPDQNAIS